MALQAREFEVQLIKADGSVAIVMKVCATEPADACSQTNRLLKEPIESANVWYESVLVAKMYPGVETP
jgi:hypothetical protein